jgi:hypothetical protein
MAIYRCVREWSGDRIRRKKKLVPQVALLGLRRPFVSRPPLWIRGLPHPWRLEQGVGDCLGSGQTAGAGGVAISKKAHLPGLGMVGQNELNEGSR